MSERFAAGADKVSINTAAVQNPAFVREAALQFGSSTIVVAIDAKRRDENGWEVFTHGGRKATGIDAVEWAKRMETAGCGRSSSPAWTGTERRRDTIWR